MATGERKDPFRGFNFRVEIDGINVGSFSDVQRAVKRWRRGRVPQWRRHAAARPQADRACANTPTSRSNAATPTTASCGPGATTSSTGPPTGATGRSC